MRSSIISYTFPITILILYLFIGSSDGLKSLESNMALRTVHEIRHPSWTFPKDRPYHYFNSTREIPHNFLPVQTRSLSDGDGVWVLRYKDFSGLPRRFIPNRSIDTSKSVINFVSQVRIFNSVSVKALAYGDVQLDLVYNRNVKNPGNQFYQMQVTDKVSLFGENGPTNCTAPGLSKGLGNGLQWINFKVENMPTGEVSLEASIHHSKSFLIIDEIIINFDGGCEDRNLTKLAACIENTTTIPNKLIDCTVLS